MPDETTTYTLTCDMAEIEIEAADMDDARAQAIDCARQGSYDTCRVTSWEDVSIQRHVCPWDGEEDCGCADCQGEVSSIPIHPTEPRCSPGEDHDWAAPHSLVGGVGSNPGVQGHGGGVVCEEACMLCGCGRTTDTWAQRPDTGEQGLTSILYEEGRYDLGQELECEEE